MFDDFFNWFPKFDKQINKIEKSLDKLPLPSLQHATWKCTVNGEEIISSYNEKTGQWETRRMEPQKKKMTTKTIGYYIKAYKEDKILFSLTYENLEKAAEDYKQLVGSLNDHQKWWTPSQDYQTVMLSLYDITKIEVVRGQMQVLIDENGEEHGGMSIPSFVPCVLPKQEYTKPTNGTKRKRTTE